MIHKLFLRAFPYHFATNSTYAHFPFVTPEGNRVILARLGSDASYSFEAKPERPIEPTILEPTAIAGSSNLHEAPVELARTLESSKPILLTALGQLKCKLNRSRDRVCEEPVEIDLVEEVIAPYFVQVFCSHLFLELPKTKYDGLHSTEVWEAMKSIHAPACNPDPVASPKLKRKATDAVEMFRAHHIQVQKARLGRSLRERLLERWQDSQEVDHSMCPALKTVAHQLVHIHQILVECIEYFLTDGREHIAGIQQLSAGMKGDNPRHARKVATRVLHYLLEGYRMFIAGDGHSIWRKTPDSTHNFANVSATARDNGFYPDAMTLSLDRELEDYGAIGLGKSQLKLLKTQAVLALFLELATFSKWNVLDGRYGLPQRVNMASHHLSLTDEAKPMDIREGGWGMMERNGSFVDSSWIVVSNEGCNGSDCDAVNIQKSRWQGEVTLYVNKEGGQLGNMPGGLPVAWKHGT